jgi:drug/metabolite transporter (DMT)-like permease
LISVDRQHPAGQSALIVGTLCALVAGALWGLVFIAPLVLPGASALDIASGRYVVYGLFSAVMLVLAGRATWPPTDVWRMAAKLTFVGSFVYYALTLLGIARAGAPLITLIIGVLPITMAVAGNFSAGAHAVAWSKLALPATIVLLGLGLVHVGEHGLVPSAASAAPLVGVLFGGAALAAWTWYGVRNAQYLAARSDVSASTMASLQGVTLLPLVVPLLGFSLLFAPSTSSALTAPWSFWGFAVVLGIGPSWLAGVFWNRASQLLPAGLLGQLIVFETLAGLVYAFAWRGVLPNLQVAAGAALLILGVLIGVHIFRPKS